jgi:4-carboxymuconolactone decarboxylase
MLAKETAMPRIDPLEPPYSEEVARDLAAMMPPGMEPLLLFRTLAHNPRILSKIRASNLLDRGSLERRDRELVILRSCARCGSEYEWGVHASIFARRFGLSEAEIAGTRLAVWSDPLWTERDRDLVRLVDELHEDATLSDALWERLAQTREHDQLVELIVLTGFYHTISFVTNGLQVEREAAAERFPVGDDLGTATGKRGVSTTSGEASETGVPAQEVRQ